MVGLGNSQPLSTQTCKGQGPLTSLTLQLFSGDADQSSHRGGHSVAGTMGLCGVEHGRVRDMMPGITGACSPAWRSEKSLRSRCRHGTRLLRSGLTRANLRVYEALPLRGRRHILQRAVRGRRCRGVYRIQGCWGGARAPMCTFFFKFGPASVRLPILCGVRDGSLLIPHFDVHTLRLNQQELSRTILYRSSGVGVKSSSFRNIIPIMKVTLCVLHLQFQRDVGPRTKTISS